MKKIKTPAELHAWKLEAEKTLQPRESGTKQVMICSDTNCKVSKGEDLYNSLVDEIKNAGLEEKVSVSQTGCFGLCRIGPNMMVYPERVYYSQILPEEVPRLVKEHFGQGRIVENLLYRNPGSQTPVRRYEDIDFFKYQNRIVLRNCGFINPERLDDYVAQDGYAALCKVVNDMSAPEVIDEIKTSGLRGRGGAGFLTGMKWEFAAKAAGGEKYIICNADEGDPGAFMDRSVLEGDPHSVLEGMAIAGYAIGANQGYIYIRAEYPSAVQRLELAIEQARESGFLGANIFDTDFSFDIDIRLGAGAFVCGEETALIASIEGRRGEPRPKPPFPANAGLWGKPTIINNVETLANIATVIRNGANWFAGIGTEKSKGSKVFALAGKINNNGLVEVPMGTSLGDIIFDIGGGIPGGKKFKAAQTGGPSGGCIPTQHLNTPMDYESLTALGTIMGSGGLVVMDEDTCMVDLAKFFIEFVQEESCGQCSMCRVGTKRMFEILDRITKGQGREGDIDLLLELGEGIKDASLCGLGQTAPNPVLNTIRYYRDEYEKHIKDKYCPASVCASLFNSPCQNTCPANVDVPIYIDLIRQGKFTEAYRTIIEENPFPVICGRTCNHPCESSCNRGKLDEPVAIRDLKRFAADYVLEHGGLEIPAVEEHKEEKVAIIGSGPAGLTAAYYLRRQGYQVTVFESLPTAGGMMAAGIPEYRLPKKMLQAEINTIKEMGVEIILNTAIGRDITVSDLKEQGFKAIFIAVGVHKERQLRIPGEDLDGVVSGVNFLKDVNLDTPADLSGKVVAIIGGGNVAIDAARSALRMGASEVKIVYRRRKQDMPALPEEVREAQNEGIKFLELASPVEFVSDNSRVSSVLCNKMRPGNFDKSGRRKPEPEEGSLFSVDADLVIKAIGRSVDLSFIPAEMGLGIGKTGNVKAKQDTFATNIPGIYAGGDCVSGSNTLVEAIAAGKKAATSIDKFLGGDGKVTLEQTVERKLSGPLMEEKKARIEAPLLPVEQRIIGFEEVETGYAEETAVAEACRCLRCDVR